MPTLDQSNGQRNDDEHAREIARLSRFLRRLLVVALFFAGIGLVTMPILIHSPAAIAAVLMLPFCAASWLALRSARGGDTERAAVIVGYSILGLVASACLAVPFANPLLSPILAVLIVLPYVKGRTLARFLATAFLVIGEATLANYFLPPKSPLPQWMVFTTNVAEVLATAYLVLVMIWQFSSHMRHTVERERRARTQTDAARLRAAFLAEAGTALSGSLDYDATLAEVGKLAVPRMADWCTVSSLGADGELRPVAVFHKDADKQALVEEYNRSFPPSARTDRYRFVLDAPRAVLTPRVTREMLEIAADGNVDHRRLLEQLGVSSSLIVPIAVHGTVFGLISFMLSGDRTYDESDAALAEALANRAALAAENARLYQNERDAVQLRDDFLGIAGHEMKTPLTALSLQTHSVVQALQHNGESSRATALGRLDRVTGSIRRLTRLVDELLDISRVTSGRLALELGTVDLAALVRDVVGRFAETASGTGSSIRVTSPKELVGQWDALRMDQVVTNLLTNALKYGSGNPIDVELTEATPTIVLKVTDRGIGIDAKDQARIFERFERAVSHRHFGGLGLGLWITRQVVEASGGNISVDSTEGSGATFTVTLPARE